MTEPTSGSPRSAPAPSPNEPNGQANDQANGQATGQATGHATGQATRQATYQALAFDYGEWRIGIAIGDRRLGTGRPLTTLHNRNADQIDWAAIEALTAEWQPAALVVGWPIDDAGRCYPQAAAVRRFANRLRVRSGRPVYVVDERLSSEQAAERLGRQTIARDPAQLDAMAAAVILDGFFAEDSPRPIEDVTKAEVTTNLVDAAATGRD
ncbi:MAG: Holliday junction resolvase RuvX [Halothiobacillaceae bacterium]|nr:Holliday junction resolvase RuvX [Halothiobacillaceae bacterium]HER33836.1 Holliday junction resolvase RuvX [Halothiobacillaceae bacterium]